MLVIFHFTKGLQMKKKAEARISPSGVEFGSGFEVKGIQSPLAAPNTYVANPQPYVAHDINSLIINELKNQFSRQNRHKKSNARKKTSEHCFFMRKKQGIRRPGWRGPLPARFHIALCSICQNTSGCQSLLSRQSPQWFRPGLRSIAWRV